MKKIVLFPFLMFVCVVDLYSQVFPTDCNRFSYPFSITMADCNNGIYTLKFEDNFNGSNLDLSKWELQSWGQGSLDLNCEDGSVPASQQLFRLDNIVVSNGTLKIIADNQPDTGRVDKNQLPNIIMCDGRPNLRTYTYTSSNIWTKKNDFLEGKYEIRCRISKGKGLWPAFWTFSGDSDPGGTIWCEHDFFEIYHDDNNFKYTNNIHFDLNNDGGTGGEQCPFGTGFNSGNDFENWHTYTIYFERDKIEYFIDGNFINRKTRYITTSGQSLFCGDGSIGAGSAWDVNGWPRQTMQLILNTSIQKGDNEPDASTIFPAVFEIDYVRYWERAPTPLPCNNDVIKFFPFTGYDWGDKAALLGGAKVISGYSAEIVAREFIEILPNFEVEAGATFTARIDPLICGVARLANDTTTDYTKIINHSKEAYPVVNNAFKIYPNPNAGQFIIELENIEEESLIEVYDVMGNKVLSDKMASKNQINLTTYTKGIYLVKVIAGNKVFIEKIIYQ